MKSLPVQNSVPKLYRVDLGLTSHHGPLAYAESFVTLPDCQSQLFRDRRRDEVNGAAVQQHGIRSATVQLDVYHNRICDQLESGNSWSTPLNFEVALAGARRFVNSSEQTTRQRLGKQALEAGSAGGEFWWKVRHQRWLSDSTGSVFESIGSSHP